MKNICLFAICDNCAAVAGEPDRCGIVSAVQADELELAPGVIQIAVSFRLCDAERTACRIVERAVYIHIAAFVTIAVRLKLCAADIISSFPLYI